VARTLGTALVIPGVPSAVPAVCTQRLLSFCARPWTGVHPRGRLWMPCPSAATSACCPAFAISGTWLLLISCAPPAVCCVGVQEAAGPGHYVEEPWGQQLAECGCSLRQEWGPTKGVVLKNCELERLVSSACCVLPFWCACVLFSTRQPPARAGASWIVIRHSCTVRFLHLEGCLSPCFWVPLLCCSQYLHCKPYYDNCLCCFLPFIHFGMKAARTTNARAYS